MPRYLAIVLGGACVVMLMAFYLMAPAMQPYNLDSTAQREAAARQEVSNPDETGVMAILMERVGTNLELARHQYLGEHLPETPDGWQIEKTNHDEIYKFTLDYKLELDLNDRSSVRRLTGWGSTTMARNTDVKYTKGDKVIFVRLTGRQHTKDDPVGAYNSRIFNGRPTETVDDYELAGLTWRASFFEGVDIMNMTANVGHDTAIGIFTNASPSEVFELMQGMDLMAFAAERGLDKDGNPATNDGKQNYINAATMTAEPPENIRAPGDNFMAGLTEEGDEIETAAVEPNAVNQRPNKSKPTNLLDALLAGAEKEKETKINRPKAGGGSFERKSGSFSSGCDQAKGAKFCKVTQ